MHWTGSAIRSLTSGAAERALANKDGSLANSWYSTLYFPAPVTAFHVSTTTVDVDEMAVSPVGTLGAAIDSPPVVTTVRVVRCSNRYVTIGPLRQPDQPAVYRTSARCGCVMSRCAKTNSDRCMQWQPG